MLFVCISRSRGKLIWPNCLCHRSISNLTFSPLGEHSGFDFVRFEDKHPPFRHPCVMTFPSSSMKHPSCVNRTSIPWSKIYPTDTRFFMIVRTCRTFISFPFNSTWFRGNCPTCVMVCRVSSPVLTNPGCSVSPNMGATLRGSSYDWRSGIDIPHLVQFRGVSFIEFTMCFITKAMPHPFSAPPKPLT